MTNAPSVPVSTPEEQALLAHARWLFAGECTFEAGAGSIEAIPPLYLPEIAFIGRSNVGKSSLLNALTARKTLARVSHTPGRTQQLNFFSVRNQLMLVDLPGYGYAKASKTEVYGWHKLIHDYLVGRPNLRRVCLLIDSRHGIKPTDTEIMCLLDKVAICYQVVLTKIDKAGKAEIDKIIEFITNSMPKHPALHPEILVTSSRDREGIEALQGALASFGKEA
ncbi:MAG: YihA family ribosome biosis GTP-binding protein [Rickettsiales bacterium]|jgi:GTP-binding protein|nr:YihA family ribosome biosis GTP-binding protein [Rickettsiales bacterium]